MHCMRVATCHGEVNQSDKGHRCSHPDTKQEGDILIVFEVLHDLHKLVVHSLLIDKCRLDPLQEVLRVVNLGLPDHTRHNTTDQWAN